MKDLSRYLPEEVGSLSDLQTDIPRIAKDAQLVTLIRQALSRIPTKHDLFLQDATAISLPKNSIHLVVTSPPYWTLKEYRDTPGQLGHIKEYDTFLDSLDRVWRACFDALVPGGRLICVVGDVCLSRKKNFGRHTVVPLHASIQEHCRKIGYDNLATIFWHKISNASYEVENGSSFLGKPFEPNAVIKNDVEFILMERKPGGYRAPDMAARILSVIPADEQQEYFQQIWSGLTGASTRDHPAPYPEALADRLIRMFSFVGDTVLDPFLGTGTTTVAAAKLGRNSIGFEIDDQYLRDAAVRITSEVAPMFSGASIEVHGIPEWQPIQNCVSN